MRRSATASSFLNTGTTSINFPVWQHRWWSNVCEFWPQGYLWKHHGSLLWIAPILDDEVPCSWRRLKLIGMNTEHPLFWILWIRHVWFKQVLCNDLSFDLVQCGGIVFSFQLPSFGSSPKTIACFWIFQAGCSWRFMKMALQLPFSLFFCHSSRSSSWRA